MNGELALSAALAATGGRWLRAGGRTAPPDLTRGSSSFQYVGSFTAQLPPRGLLRRHSTVASAEEWLLELRARGVTDLALVTDRPVRGPLPGHVASAFTNSGGWLLLATGGTAPTGWSIGWEVGQPDAADSRIWSLTAGRVPADGLSAPQIGVAEARDRLRAALAEIRTFAERTEAVSGWASWFARAEMLLDDSSPTPPYHGDLLPPDAALERRQLAAAVVQGWVFGGMGSWNDAGFEDPAVQREYVQVGANLYAALLAALPAAVNGA